MLGTIHGRLDRQGLGSLAAQMPANAQVLMQSKVSPAINGEFTFEQVSVSKPTLALMALKNGSLLLSLFTEKQSEIELSLRSTAIASVLLMPQFLNQDPALLARQRSVLEASLYFDALLTSLSAMLQDPEDQGLQEAYQTARATVAKDLAAVITPPEPAFQTANSRFIPFSDLIQEEYNHFSPLYMSLPGDPEYAGAVRQALAASFDLKADRDTTLNVGLANYSGLAHVGKLSVLKAGQANDPSSWEIEPIQHLAGQKPVWNDERGTRLFASTSPYFLVFPAKLKIKPSNLFWGGVEVAFGGAISDKFGNVVSHASLDLDANQNRQSILSHSSVSRETQFLSSSFETLNSERQSAQDYPVEFLKAQTRYVVETRSGVGLVGDLGQLLGAPSEPRSDAHMNTYAVTLNLMLNFIDLLEIFTGIEIDELSKDILLDPDVAMTFFALVQQKSPSLFAAMTSGNPYRLMLALVNLEGSDELRHLHEALGETLIDKAKDYGSDVLGRALSLLLMRKEALAEGLLNNLSIHIKAGELAGGAIFNASSYLGGSLYEGLSAGTPYRVFAVNRYFPLPSLHDFKLSADGTSANFKILYYNFEGDDPSKLYLNDREVPLSLPYASYDTITRTSLIKNLRIPFGPTETGYGLLEVKLNLTANQDKLKAQNLLEVRSGKYSGVKNQARFNLADIETQPETSAPHDDNPGHHVDNQIVYVATLPGSLLKAVYSMNPDGNGTQRLSPESTGLAIDANPGKVTFTIEEVQTGKRIYQAQSPQIYMALSKFLWSPDSKKVLHQGYGVVSVPEGRLNPVPNLTKIMAETPMDQAYYTWSPDSQKIAFLNKQLYTYHPDRDLISEPLLQFTEDIKPFYLSIVRGLAWSQDSRFINLTNYGKYRTLIVSSESPGTPFTAPWDKGRWSHQGAKWLSYSYPRLQIKDFNEPNSQSRTIQFEGGQFGFDSLLWSPDDMRILLLRYDVRPNPNLSHGKSEVLDLDGKLLNEFVLADAKWKETRKNITHPNYPNLILDFEHFASDINFQVCTFTTGTCFFDQNLKVEDLVWVGSKTKTP